MSALPMDQISPAIDGHGRQVGRVVCVSGSQVIVVVGRPDDDVGDDLALKKGELVKMLMPGTMVFGMVTGLSVPVPAASGKDETRLAELELIGESKARGDGSPACFRRGISAYPALGDTVFSVGQADLASVYAPPAASTIRIGSVHQDRSRPVCIAPDDLLGKHFAIIGTTGCGKSCAVALILKALLENHPNAHVVVLDPHDEYAQAFGETAEILGQETLQLPYWLLNGDEIASVILGAKGDLRNAEAICAILNELIPIAKRAFVRSGYEDVPITVNTPVPYRLTDVVDLLDETMGRLDKPDNLAPYRWLKARLEVLCADSRFAFMFGGISIQDSMARILSRILRIPVGGRPLSIIDLSGIPSEALNIVVSVLCRMIFDFALWSRGAQPILLVCEEAHRYAPADPSLGFEPTKEALARIAKEGRKYGVSLAMISQRPSELAPGILSQCNTTFAFRMTSLRDQEIVRGVTADSAYGLLDFLPSLGDAEAVVVGEGVPLPLRLTFDHLPPDRQPRSGTASFSSSWQESGYGEDFVVEVVERWRRQQR